MISVRCSSSGDGVGGNLQQKDLSPVHAMPNQ